LGAARDVYLLVSFLAICAVFVAKLDGLTVVSWYAVLVPLWALDAVVVVFLLILIGAAIRASWWKETILVSVVTLAALCLVAFQALLAVKVDPAKNFDIPYIAVVSPLLLVCVIAIGLQVYKFVKDEKKMIPPRRMRAWN